MPIRRLDNATIGHIAAGEVIERPVSVVKELVENALDAGAHRITVSLREGGFAEIEVSDDGSGIAPEELPLALERHATSKLVDAVDLLGVRTLGFRGEGLASIAAVAQVRIASRRAGDELAACVEAFEERIGALTLAPGSVGTRVVARDLFRHAPVRREYLRSPQAEATRVASFLATLALGYPDVAFILRIDGVERLNLPPAREPVDRLAHVFGREAYERMLPIAPLDTAMHGTVRGFLSRPGHERGDRRAQVLFVNGRLARGQMLAGAWSGGYAGFSLVGRHPFGVLLLDIPPDHVDPNVHPTKSEVRLRYAAQVNDAVRRVIVTTLHRDATARLEDTLSPGFFAEREHVPRLNPQASNASEVSTPWSSDSPSWQASRRTASTPSPAHERLDFAEEAAPAASLRVLTQLDRAFLLATDGRGILLVDQHAAHERIAYEEIAAAAQRDEMPLIQPLFVPELIELDAVQAARLEPTLEALQAIGVEIAWFGERVVRVTALPAIFAERRFDVRGYLADLDDETPGLDARHHVWATMACHSVVRAGETMALPEMQQLIDRLATCANPMHCPHGRPTMARLDAPQIARLFRRT